MSGELRGDSARAAETAGSAVYTCTACGAQLRTAQPPPPGSFRLACPSCKAVFLVEPAVQAGQIAPALAAPTSSASPYGGVWVCEPREDFAGRLARALHKIGFEPTVITGPNEPSGMPIPRLALVSSFYLAMPDGLWGRLQSAEPRPRLILLGEIHNANRYHRTPDRLYGADAYLEELPDDARLETALRERLGLRAPDPPPDGDDPAALKLAREMFSDLIMQNSDTLSGLDAGGAAIHCADEVERGRRHLEERFPGAGGLIVAMFNDYLRLKI